MGLLTFWKKSRPGVHVGDITISSLKDTRRYKDVHTVVGNVTVRSNVPMEISTIVGNLKFETSIWSHHWSSLVTITGGLIVNGHRAHLAKLSSLGWLSADDHYVDGIDDFLPNLSSYDNKPIMPLEFRKCMMDMVADRVLSDPTSLNMRVWHDSCGTAHCVAGWAITLSGKIGETLEKKYSSKYAGLSLLGFGPATHFFSDRQSVLEWMKRRKSGEEPVVTDDGVISDI